MSARVVIACGGTGGHLFPGIAVAESLLDAGGSPLLIISEKEIDAIAMRNHKHLEYVSCFFRNLGTFFRGLRILPFHSSAGLCRRQQLLTLQTKVDKKM